MTANINARRQELRKNRQIEGIGPEVLVVYTDEITVRRVSDSKPLPPLLMFTSSREY